MPVAPLNASDEEGLFVKADASLFLLSIAVLSAAAAEPAIRRLDGSSISRPEIDATVTRLMKGAEVTGAGIAILNGGKVVHSKAYGFRDKDRKLPLTEDSVLAAASFTKVAFSYLVMQLVDDRLLDLAQPVQRYLPKPLPDYPAYRDLASDERYKEITAAMLLSHTAGFPNYRWLNSDRKLTINFEPGSRYAYSGEGMELLQFVVETITKKPLKDLMQARVFQPLSMSRTSMVSEDRFENDYASGYDEWGRALGHQQRKSANAAGSMQTTLRDFTIFVQAVADGRGLSKRTRHLMLSPQIRILSKHQFPTLTGPDTDANNAIRLSYGLGWGLYKTPHGNAFFKEGHDEGFRNYTVVFEKPKDGIVIMTNSSNGEGIFKELLETLLGNTYTPIEWEGFTPYNGLPPRPALPTKWRLLPRQTFLTGWRAATPFHPIWFSLSRAREITWLCRRTTRPRANSSRKRSVDFSAKPQTTWSLSSSTAKAGRRGW